MTRQRFTFLSAVHVFLVRGGQVLLLRRFNTGYEDGSYSVPAGHLDGNEQVVNAALRELREEVGVTAEPAAVAVVGVMHRRSERTGDAERIDFFVAVNCWDGEPKNCEPDRCDGLLWSTIEDLPDNVIPYVGRALANLRRGRWFDSFGW